MAFGSHDYGIDGFHIDRETKVLYLYQFKWSKDYNLFKESYDRLIEDGFERIFGNPYQDNEENSIACFLMGAYFGDNQAIKLLQSKEIDSSTKEKIITELLSIANKKMDWCFYRSAKRVFKFVLAIDKSNNWALQSIKLCDSKIDN